MNNKKAVLIVLDSFGVGALPDAAEYGDAGAATLQNIIKKRPDLELKNLQSMGLFNIDGINLGRETGSPSAVFGRALEASRGKDSIVGHWELMGVVTSTPFLTFPGGFPAKVIADFEALIGRGTLANIAISGTEVIDIYGAEHIATGKPIVYTSADSVFQIAAHEQVIALEELYDYCKKARAYFDERMGVGRVIARPFVGDVGSFQRTSNRHDFAALPGSKSALQYLQDGGISTFSIGKPKDIFSSVGFDGGVSTNENTDGIEKLIEAVKSRDGFIFANLIDFDMLYGHRRDAGGYANALAEFDAALPRIIDALDGGLLIITADHGCDPTHSGSDHTREYIPVLAYHSGISAKNAGTRLSFADVGAAVLHWFGLDYSQIGASLI